jgi:uncharacterized protein
VPTVILHGWQGSGPEHWQTWLAGELTAAGREVRFPCLPDQDAPEVGAWLAALRETISGLPDDGFDVVCHSLASVLWLHHANDPAGAPRPARVALVAPPTPSLAEPAVATFFPPPLDIDAVRRAADGTVLVAADADPLCPEGTANAYGRPLKMPTTVIAGGGHLNADSGYGSWPAVLDWCGRGNLAFIA